MRIHRLHIKNIGPFRDAQIEFATEDNAANHQQPVTIITGMNGTGKSIVIDALRAALSGNELERNIVANPNDFSIEMDLSYNDKRLEVKTSQMDFNGAIQAPNEIGLEVVLPLQVGYGKSGVPIQPWLIDYWSSKLPSDSFRIASMTAIEHQHVMKDVMMGKKSHIDLVNFICHIDYLRSSDMPEEQELGRVIYAKLQEIVSLCLDGGCFKYVRRSDLTPIVEQNGVDLSLDKLSSGNLFLVEHLVLLLCKMYSVSVLNHLPAQELCNVRGLLLIDEIETHLHPFWQKRIVGIIRRLFPHLQIILTTHSPFVVTSVEDAAVYTCVAHTGYSVISNETEQLASLPVDEVLLSDVFGGVHPFNDEITELIKKRKELKEQGNKVAAHEIEERLLTINPEYFAYLK